MQCFLMQPKELVLVHGMASSKRHQDLISQHTNQAGSFPAMEWKTPAISDKFQSRFGRCPSTADSGDTGLGTTPSDSTEDFCSSSDSASFQPIRTQISIPTAHVMPSTAGILAQMNSAAQDSRDSRTKSSPLSKPDPPNLDMGGMSNGDVKSAPVDSVNRYRTLVNELEYHSLFPNADKSCLDECGKFNRPAIEPTMNQSALLDTFYGDPRFRTETSNHGETGKDNYGSLDRPYKTLPESKTTSLAGNVYGPQNGFLPNYSNSALNAGSAFAGQQALQSQMWMREQMNTKGYDARMPDRSCDLAAWQHQQQLESIRLQVEQMQLSAGSRPYPSLYPSALQQDTSKWDALIRANESLLKEKELVIDRQKQQISQLEQKVRESELQVHSALIGRNPSYNDVYLLRLQEAQRENTFLRAQFAEQTSGFNKEKAEAERKLAAVEAEVRKFSETLKETAQKHSEEMKKQEERVRGRDKHINSLKKKCQKESEQNREKQQRIETLERYLADLPTLEDYQKQSNQLKELERQCGQLQDTVSDLERKLGEARAQCRERVAQLESQKEKELELISQVHSLQEKVERSLEDGDRLPMLDMEKLKAENSSLKEEVERAKKVIEKQQKKMEQIASQIKRLEEQGAQEEGTSQALREDLAEKESGLQQLRKAMKELSAQNQELIERILTLQEQIGQPGQREAPQAENAQLTQRLHGEMAACLYDLQSLCNILNQRSQGRDPNLSLLLGIRSMQYSCDDRDDWMNPEVLAKKLTEVQQLRHDVEELRTTMSDRYAQDMGDNCITQ
ncbi:centrosomal protein of 85 kDa isoform X2 [Polyodon spathula]|uniref:centrosomal protein of 85 kDa isoform X2 n=1 Tax=Polyodon spathula TaxID=7913 RepID=UPI001B7DFD04|nr:centrosomal protein of 85 kDa isoform X2 [Polyodon spathula]